MSQYCPPFVQLQGEKEKIIAWIGCLDKYRTNSGLMSQNCPPFCPIAGWNRKNYSIDRVPGQIEDKFRTGVPIVSAFCPGAGWPGRKWKKDSVLNLSSICPIGSGGQMRTKVGQFWDQWWQKLVQIRTKLRVERHKQDKSGTEDRDGTNVRQK